MSDDRRNDRRRRDDRRSEAAELLGAGIVTELAGDVRDLITAIGQLRDEVRRRHVRQRAQRIRTVILLAVAIIAAAQVGAIRTDRCVTDVRDTRAGVTQLCDVVFPGVSHGPPGQHPPWPTAENIVGLALYGALLTVGGTVLYRADGLSWRREDPPDEERP